MNYTNNVIVLQRNCYLLNCNATESLKLLQSWKTNPDSESVLNFSNPPETAANSKMENATYEQLSVRLA